jgi:hypothetical protein
MRESLPAIRKRSPAERLKAMTDTLIEDAVRVYAATGTMSLPRSVVDDICRVAALNGEILSPETVTRMTLEEIRPRLEAKAKQDFIRAGHKQKESDRKKTALDWHGSANHEVVLATR